MRIDDRLTDEAVLAELATRLAHRRRELGLTQAGLAREAGVSQSTVERLEAGASVQLTSLVRVLRQLALLGKLEALLPPAVPGPMELLRHGGERKRVRRSGSRDGSGDGWEWGDD